MIGEEMVGGVECRWGVSSKKGVKGRKDVVLIVY